MQKQFNKTYNPSIFENKTYQYWEKSKSFVYEKKSTKDPSYVLMMPPPNITGSLHLGHALTYSIQDVLVRYHRMSGFVTLWQPGIDHAGIATQMLVENQLLKEGKSRLSLGRENFTKYVWDWKKKYSNAIVTQQKRLGLSADWSRHQFTLDKKFTHSVFSVFISLYNEGLIYRGSRLVNWDSKLRTAVSDLEVNNIEVQGSLYFLRYLIVGSKGHSLYVTTTRPETLFGDVAVAVHPEDKRYMHLIGQKVYLPLTDRIVPIIGDEYCNPSQGSGVVKITPAHDFNDFEVGRRHNLGSITIIDKKGFLNKNVPKFFQFLSLSSARKKIVITMFSKGLLNNIQDIVHVLPYGDRSGFILEPLLTKQWFVDVKYLKKPAVDAIKEGDAKFIPDYWKNTYFEWLNDIQPWCISRQIWWGHRIPAWYGVNGDIFVAHSEEDAKNQSFAKYGKNIKLTQDEDTLDTWFSSSLWPFATLGWPLETDLLHRFYPTSILVTGSDIIFFWVARMMMMGLHFMKKVPFKSIYIHSIIRDLNGHKMSKTKGNVIDPLKIIDIYGSDALRFALLSSFTPGRDLCFSLEQVKKQRNFATKIWNVARFCEHYNCNFKYSGILKYDTLVHPINEWICFEVEEITQKTKFCLDNHRLDLAANKLYKFVWSRFCDYYIELAKVVLRNGTEKEVQETCIVVPWVLKRVLHLLHPFMPFITEELWQILFAKDKSCLINQNWPKYNKRFFIDKGIDWLLGFINVIRSIRSEVKLPVKFKIIIFISSPDIKTSDLLRNYKSFVQVLANVESFRIVESIKSHSSFIRFLYKEVTYGFPLPTNLDLSREKLRLQQELEKIKKQIVMLQIKLKNSSFLNKAPYDVITKNKDRLRKEKKNKLKLESIFLKLKDT